ncbi:hypothetical protein B7P43_G15576, partial [Cryptotermes secundus]
IRIYKTIIFPVVLYGSQTWSLTLRVFEEVTGWGKLHNEKLHNLYSSLAVIRMIKSLRMIWARHVARMGRRRRRRMERGWVGLDWIDLAEGRDQWRARMNRVMNLRVP